MPDIRELLDALDDYAEAKAELEKMEGEYTGYSPSYHLSSWYEARNKALERFKLALDAYVDARIRLELAVRD